MYTVGNRENTLGTAFQQLPGLENQNITNTDPYIVPQRSFATIFRDTPSISRA